MKGYFILYDNPCNYMILFYIRLYGYSKVKECQSNLGYTTTLYIIILGSPLMHSVIDSI